MLSSNKFFNGTQHIIEFDSQNVTLRQTASWNVLEMQIFTTYLRSPESVDLGMGLSVLLLQVFLGVVMYGQAWEEWNHFG